MDLPKFRLSPNAYALDLFVTESGICSCCGQARELKYNSSFYSREEPDYLCPWCIADGSAAQRYEGEFNDYLGIEGVSADPDEPDSIVMDRMLLLEVCERTPSYHSWQQEQWLVHCDQPCAFVGYTDHTEIKQLEQELQADIANMPERYLQAISKTGDPVGGYLFRCMECGTHRLHTDCT